MQAMTDPSSTPERVTPSAELSNMPPLEKWAEEFVRPHRNRLLALLDMAAKRLDQASERHEQACERADRELKVLLEKIPEVGDSPTELEWLTRRAAQADYELALAQHDLARQETHVAYLKALRDYCRLELRIGQIDDVIEPAAYAAGNDAQLDIMMFELEETVADYVHAVGALELMRERLAAAKRMHREIHAALRRAKKAAEPKK